MFLFITIATLCLLLAIVGDLIKLLQLSKIFRCVYGSASSDELQQELKEARERVERVRRSSAATSHYTYTVKLMRAENELKTIQSKLRSEGNMQRLKGASVELFVSYLLKGIISLVLFIITLRNRYTPVIIFHENISFEPIGALLSFPTGVPNAISVPFWVLSCNSAFRLIVNALKGK
ncbi:guided entry of tail-anchored proteins factor 1 [Anastrepha obliqua]|uniref:guided entry of tail-anchored proteins factor 1 n=1 Tax=Anastrepha ludens TaxID=28586 RepID=UPI0023AFD502|nr:guided entry of tail-anchored proteins factor 1 [Anastrepha ludens]XP_054725177.1 guided entry of tail-anchored proteins factor 1 [Anastrepha obliqua]